MTDDYKSEAKASREAKLANMVPERQPSHRMTDQEHRDFSAESWRIATPDRTK